jgi:hypothetical protein
MYKGTHTFHRYVPYDIVQHFGLISIHCKLYQSHSQYSFHNVQSNDVFREYGLADRIAVFILLP